MILVNLEDFLGWWWFLLIPISIAISVSSCISSLGSHFCKGVEHVLEEGFNDDYTLSHDMNMKDMEPFLKCFIASHS